MALLQFCRKIKQSCLRSHVALSNSILRRSILHPFLPRFLVQTFHRTSFRPLQQSSRLGCDQRFHQIINFTESMHENAPPAADAIVAMIREAKDFTSSDEAIAFLDDTHVKPDEELIFSAIWALRDEWKLAFLVFKWGVKWDCVVEKTWCLAIWLLGNHKKFSTCWTIIHDLYRTSRDTQQALLIMIDRYAAANCANKSIETFHIMQKFKFSPDQSTYFTFLKILCEHGNIEEAEEFMLSNKKFFPLETESFNIIMNGWCNIAVDICEAKRVWREMSSYCILPDGTSYTHLISCHSRVGNLFDSLRLYDEMKKRGWVPGLAVYKSLIYILTRENCLDEAVKMLDRMKEISLQPDCTCYNSIIRPLGGASKFKSARTVFTRMIKEEINPNIDTYHALLDGKSIAGTVGVLQHMRKSGFGPVRETFLLILRKFFGMNQPSHALEVWLEMGRYEVMPDHAHYSVMVEGLVNHGMIAKAREVYAEMISMGIVGHPSLQKLVQECPEGGAVRKGSSEMTVVRYIVRGKGLRSRSLTRNRKHGKKSKEKSDGT